MNICFFVDCNCHPRNFGRRLPTTCFFFKMDYIGQPPTMVTIPLEPPWDLRDGFGWTHEVTSFQEASFATLFVCREQRSLGM